ncbi:MAG TPA: ECF-type sigma factor [Gemmatimonadaceae bacterium]|jgi:RNA polymerase sigma factor (TIGR02999 family)|nr:ECF-type sigma factor [Gemmatimonadaceae bacterium]
MTSETRESLGDVLPLVYDELHRIAHRHLRRVRGFEATLATTGLVNEAYLKLVEQSDAHWRDQSHLLALASVAMRHILIDKARARLAAKRGGGRAQVTLEEEAHAFERSPSELLEVNEALTKLEATDARLARVVELRFFAGYSETEIAGELGVTERTVQRDWKKARAFLRRALAS